MLRASSASRSVLRRSAPAFTAPLSSQAASWDYDVAIVGGGVVGAALACQLAQTPSLAGQRILVVESFAPPPLPTALAPGRPVDLRTYAMTPKSEEFLRDLGVWEPLENAGRTQPYAAMQVWSRGGNHGGHIVWDAANHSPARKSSTASSGTEPPKPHLGTIVEHTSLQSALYNRLQVLHAEGKLELRCPAQVKKAVFSTPPSSHRQAPPAAVLHLEEPTQQPPAPPASDAATVTTVGESSAAGGKPAAPAAPAPAAAVKQQSAVTCRLVVAADGAQSPLRKAAGLGTWGWSYGQRAVVATVDVGALGLQRNSGASTSSSSASGGGGSEAPLVALQRFLPTGPVALLPLWEVPSSSEVGNGSSSGDAGSAQTTRLASVIWSTEPRHADALCAMPEEEFIAALNTALQDNNSSSTSSHDTGVGFGGWETGADKASTSTTASSSSAPNFSAAGAGVGAGGATAGGLVGLLQKAVEGPLGAFVVSSAEKVAQQGSVTLKSAARNVLTPLVQAAERAGALTGENSQFEPAPRVVQLAPQSKRFAIDLNLQQAYAYADWRIALVGDAAHSVHPMAGQGLNLGLADAQALADTLDASARAGADLGDPSPSGHLAAYASDRKQAALQLMASLDMLHRLFGDAPAPAMSASSTSTSSAPAAASAASAAADRDGEQMSAPQESAARAYRHPGAAPGAAEAVAIPGASAAGFGAMGSVPLPPLSHGHSAGHSNTAGNRGNSENHGSALAGKGGPTTVGALPWPVRRAAGDLREAGLATLNLLPPLKALLAKHAMGLK